MAVELCQSLVDVEPSIDHSYPMYLLHRTVGQEQECNSLGSALGPALAGFTYDEYVKTIAGRAVRIGSIDTPLLQITQQKYSQLLA